MASVIVGCKIPNGLVIRLAEQVEMVETPDRRDRYTVVVDQGEQITLAGIHTPGVIASAEGYGLTIVDDGEAMKKWLADNKDQPSVKNGFIFIEESKERAADKAKDAKGKKTGLERLDYNDPLGDKRIEPTKTLDQAKREAADQAKG